MDKHITIQYCTFTRKVFTGVDFVGRVFNDLSLLVFPFLPKEKLISNTRTKLCKFGHVRQTYFSSVLETLVLVFTSHNFTVQSAEPDARIEPSELIHPIIMNSISLKHDSNRPLVSTSMKLIYFDWGGVSPESKWPDTWRVTNQRRDTAATREVPHHDCAIFITGRHIATIRRHWQRQDHTPVTNKNPDTLSTLHIP
jgi:hypothetical protein